MATKLEFIIAAIVKVAKTDRMEGLEGGETVTIKGTKKGFLKNEVIQILIKRSQKDPKVATFVTADINGQSESEDILKEILYDILKKTDMLDSKLNMKLDMLFNQTGFGPLQFEGGQLKLKGGLAALAVSGYQAHLHTSWPELKDKIKIEIIDGTDGKEIGFTQTLGWKDEEWLSFFYNGIILDAALNNCDKFGVEKLVFFVNDEFADFTIAKLRELKK
ncbi:MAG TPA: hypothetical protein VIM07_11495 [Chitinophagaceae bacterium]